jgi:UDP-N-acetylglucosamine--N-acetylmuramyl-(pentapeptide) pyrophosphoryl-undecaprenol N-acetylglucosamine transferase
MKYVFTCGGTAGHIYPAVSIAQKLSARDKSCDFLFIGARGMMEMDIVPKEGYPIEAIPVSNLSRGKGIDDIIHNLKTVFNLFSSFFRSLSILKKAAPDAVIGTGGYVCFPVLSAARLLGIPTFIHESNAVPGLTTKMLTGIVDRIFVGYESSMKYYPSSKVLYAGTPVRDAFLLENDLVRAKKDLGLDPDFPMVLSVWGSLGSGFMNGMIEKLSYIFPSDSFNLIHVTGKQYYKEYGKIEENVPQAGQRTSLSVRDYLYEIPKYFSAADLILCRAGASTLSELAYIGKPAIIVPSPNVTNNHQEKNARVFESAGAAIVLTEGSFSAETLLDAIRKILTSEDRKNTMSQAMRSFCVPDSAERIADSILSFVQSEKGN